MTPILLASFSLTLFALLSAWLLKRFQIKSPLIHRATWGIVLFQGVVFAGIPLQLPVLDPAQEYQLANPSSSSASLEESHDQPVETNAAAAPLPAIDSGPVSSPKSIWLLLYICGCLLGLVYFAIAYIALMISLRKATPATVPWANQLASLLQNRNIDPDTVSLLVHPRLGPLLCRLPSGYAIVLPETEWNALTAAQRGAVLDHEIAHIERRDIWKSFAMRLLALVHWFNPMAWWAARQFEEAAEWDCDRRLTDQGTQNAVNYAKALLSFAEPKTPLPIGASLARGASLSPRIDRLTSGVGNHKDPRSRRLIFALALTFFGIVSLLRFDLIAREIDGDDDHAAFVESLAAFSGRVTGSGEILENFKTSIATKPGQIVMKDLAAEAGQAATKKIIASAIPDHIKHYYDSIDEKLILKSEHATFKENLLRTNQSYQKDIADMQSAMRQIHTSLANDTEANKLMARFIGQENAAQLLYMEAIRDQMHPGTKLIRDRLGSVLAPGKNGKLAIIPSRMEQAQSVIRKGQLVHDLAKRLRAELPNFINEIAAPDSAHKSCKKVMSEPAFASFVAAEYAEKHESRSIGITVDLLFANLEGGFVDQADGLHIAPGKHQEMEEVLERFQLVAANLEPVSEALSLYASQIDEQDELNRSIKEILLTPAATMLFAIQFKEPGHDAGYHLKKLLESVLESDRDGALRVRKDKQEEIVVKMREFLPEVRNLGRKQRELGELMVNFEDKELEAIYQSASGRLIILQLIRKEIEGLKSDGLALWFSEHFVEIEGGKLEPRAESMELLERINRKAAEIAKSLKSDL